MAWWHHQMETFFALRALCAGNSPVTSEFPSQRPMMRSFDIFFDLRLSKMLCKQLRCRWFEMPLCSLWCHCNGGVCCDFHGDNWLKYGECTVQLHSNIALWWPWHHKNPHPLQCGSNGDILSNLQYKSHLSRQKNCPSLRCSWSIACRHCSNYIFILDLAAGFIGLGKDNCKTRWETFKFWDLSAYIRGLTVYSRTPFSHLYKFTIK